nr:ATP-binding protein [uncultured Treponema sp.]
MDNLQFKVSSALKDLVGKDLIRNENIAIFELVKNSYDAFATKVEITFEPERIIIADNGKGMSLEDLKEKWLFLAYSAKKDGSEDSESDEKQQSYRDQINRHYAGAKGVGRFSCDRLGANLIVITKNQKDKNAEKLIIDWTAFEKDQKKEFIEVDVQHEALSSLPKFPEDKETGTILEITNLRNIWARDEILRLKQSLEKLINPFSESLDFTIEIICEWAKEGDENEKNKSNYYDRNIVNGVIKNSISQVIGLKTTKIDVTLNTEFIETSIIDRDVEIYKIREKNTFDKLSSVTINLYFLNKAAKTAFSMKMGVQPVNYGSIFLFRNGFRILPFGNPGDDSWKLDYRAQQGYNRFLGTRDLFGRVDIQTDKIDEFKEVSSRDGGLIQSETTLQLMRLFENTHHRLERYVSGVLWGEGFLKRQYFKDVTDVEKNRVLLGKDKELDSADYVINSSLGSKIDFVQLVKTLISDKNIEVLSYNKQLANIFSEPTLFDNANPQVITDLERIAEKTKDADLMSSVDDAKRKIAELQKQKADAERRAEEADIRAAQAESDRNKAQYEASVAKVKQEKAEKKNEELQKDVERVSSENLFLTSDVSKDVKQLSSLQHHITHTSSFIHSLAMKALDSINANDKDKTVKFIQQILFENTKIATLSNFVSKANFDLMAKKITKDIVNFVNEYMLNVYSLANKDEITINVKDTNIKYELLFAPIDFIVVLDSLLDNSKKANAKNVFITWFENNDTIELHFKDDGNGIKDDVLPKIFDYRFTTTKGGGLGLYHVNEICKKMNIDIKVNNKNNGLEFIFIIKREK